MLTGNSNICVISENGLDICFVPSNCFLFPLMYFLSAVRHDTSNNLRQSKQVLCQVFMIWLGVEFCLIFSEIEVTENSNYSSFRFPSEFWSSKRCLYPTRQMPYLVNYFLGPTYCLSEIIFALIMGHQFAKTFSLRELTFIIGIFLKDYSAYLLLEIREDFSWIFIDRIW